MSLELSGLCDLLLVCHCIVKSKADYKLLLGELHSVDACLLLTACSQSQKNILKVYHSL